VQQSPAQSLHLEIEYNLNAVRYPAGQKTMFVRIRADYNGKGSLEKVWNNQEPTTSLA
jgi:hypothetical protein